MKKRMLVVLAASAALSLVMASTGAGIAAFGAEEDWSSQENRLELYEQLMQADDPEDFFMNLSPGAQTALISVLTPTELLYRESVTDTTGQVTAVVEGWSADNVHVYDFSTTIKWEYDGSLVTHIYFATYDPQPLVPLVFFDGIEQWWKDGGEGLYYYSKWYQGIFSMRIWEWTVWTDYVGNGLLVMGNGSYSGFR